MLDLRAQRIVVTGGAGFLGRYVCERLARRGCGEIIVPRRMEFDLTCEDAVARLYAGMKPDIVIHLAAEGGGISANRDQPGRFMYANLAMGLHLIEHARRVGLRKFVQVGTICSYPGECDTPFREEDLWGGFPEPTNAPYGIAKKSLLVLLESYHRQYGLPSAYVMPTNLYGPGDNCDPRTSHVIPALIRKCLEAIDQGENHITVWGSGTTSRDFLYVDDAAEGIIMAAQCMEEPVPINLGSGREISIEALVRHIAERTGFRGDIRWDSSQPEGQLRRCVDTGRALEFLGWQAETNLEMGLRRTVESMRSALTLAFGP